MSLKAALRADLAAKGMKLGDLADKLGITQQSVSKWIAKDEIPKDRVSDVTALLAPEVATAEYLLAQAKKRLSNTVLAQATHRLRTLPQPGDEDDHDARLVRYASENYPPPPRVQTSPPTPYHLPVTSRFEVPPPPKLNVPPAPRVDWPKAVPIVGSAIDSARNVAMNRARLTHAWAARLPEELELNVNQAVEVQGVVRRFEYLSKAVAVLVRPQPRMDPARLFEVAVPLMLLHATAAVPSCHLVLVPRAMLGFDDKHGFPPEELNRRFGMVKRDLDALGVTVTELQSPLEVAEYIAAKEQAAKPIFSYEDFDDYEAQGVEVGVVDPAPPSRSKADAD